MANIIDLYWSFRSPYSYLASKSALALRSEWDVEINVKIVYPLAVRQPEFFDSRGPEWMGYTLRDVVRLAEMTGQTIAMPTPDPIITDMKTGTFATQQPHIERLSRLGVLACEAGRGLEFIDEVGALIWSGKPWNEDDHLAQAVSRAGLDLKTLETKIDKPALDKKLADHDTELRAAGHWGVPTFVLKGEPFFGQDRIEVLKWRLQKSGVRQK